MFASLAANVRWSGICVTLAALATLGCDSSQSGRTDKSERRLVILINGDSPYWGAARFGMEKAAEDFKLADAKLSVVMESNDATTAGQIDKLRQFASQSDIAAVAVSAVDATNAAIADEMRTLRQKGVHVIALDNDINRQMYRDAREFYIGTDNLAAGHELGLAAKALLPEGGEFADFVGRTGAQNAMDRMNGFQETAGDTFKELDRMGDEFDRSKAQENVRHTLRNFPNVKLLNGIYSYNGPAIVDVVRELGKRDQIKILTFDAEKSAIEQMGNGMIDAMVVQDPYNMGYLGVRLMKALVEKDDATVKDMFPKAGEPDGDLYDTGIKVVVPESSPLQADMFGKKTQFLHLPEFKEWLAKYKLDAS